MDATRLPHKQHTQNGFGWLARANSFGVSQTTTPPLSHPYSTTIISNRLLFLLIPSPLFSRPLPSTVTSVTSVSIALPLQLHTVQQALPCTPRIQTWRIHLHHSCDPHSPATSKSQ